VIQRPKSAKDQHLSGKERKLYANQDPSDGPIMLVRKNDWQELFVSFIHESRVEGIKCDWEFNHCAGWCAQGVEEITGYDFFAPFADYPIDGPEMAYKAIKRAGYESLEQYIEICFVEKPLIFANRGDLVFVPSVAGDFAGLGMSQALGLADPPNAWVLGTEGLGWVRLAECTRCFAVGSLG
jgi:hypothetical protein